MNEIVIISLVAFVLITGLLVIAGVFAGAWIVHRSRTGASPLPPIPVKPRRPKPEPADSDQKPNKNPLLNM